MDTKELLLLLSYLGLLGGLRLTSTTTTTTFVAAMSIANQDLERYFRTTNTSQTLSTMTEDRFAIDVYAYAFLNYTYYTVEQGLVEVKFNEEQARYGEGQISSVTGKLVHITDNDKNGVDFGKDYACTPDILGSQGRPTPAPGSTWIALVQRGHCTFEEKVKNVHAKGAAAVIIYNEKPVMNLEKMQIKGKSRNITAVITYQKVGQDMAWLIDRGEELVASIEQGRQGSRPINTLNRTSVLFVSISFIVLMIISLVWLIFYYIQKFRYLQTKDQQSRMLCSVTKKAIMKIPTKTGKTSDEKDADSDCCAICIEAYKPSDCIRVLPCKHEFHKNCIDPWLIEHRTCPMCKLDVLKFYGYVVGDQITASPNPNHTPPNIPTNATPSTTTSQSNELDDVQVVPIIVVPMPMGVQLIEATAASQQNTIQSPTATATTTQPLQQQLSSIDNSSSSGSSSSSNSNNNNSSSSNSSSSIHNENSSNNTSNISNSQNNSSSNSNSSSGNRNANNNCCCNNNQNANATVDATRVQEISTASRQVTDV